MKTKCWVLLICILGPLLASCQLLSSPGPVEAKQARDLTWQALVKEYQPDEYVIHSSRPRLAVGYFHSH